MRKLLVVGLSVVAILATLAPPAFAQAPAPKVTINGLMDVKTSWSKNWDDIDVTDSRDQLWYSDMRGRFDIVGQVGASKMVWGIELDFGLGSGSTPPGQSSTFDLDTDVPGFTETKWLYIETNFTGPNGIIPAPIVTKMRAGAQPAAGHAYKSGILWSGDFPGVSFETTWAPPIKSTITYAQISEALDSLLVGASAGRPESFALLASVEITPMKGTAIKPTLTYERRDAGNTTGTANLGSEAKNGFNPNTRCPTTGACTATTGDHLVTERTNLGAEAKLQIGPVFVEPSVFLQLGEQEIPRPAAAGGTGEVDIRSGIADVIAGVALGPLKLSGRAMYTPGMAANHFVLNGSDIAYYQPINPGFVFMSGWTEIQVGGVEYSNSLFVPAGGVTLRQSPSYDKYGRIFFGAKAEYQFTPAYGIWGLTNISWTDEKVDTHSTIGATGLVQCTVGPVCNSRGEDRYLGNEWAIGHTWRFAPNLTLDMSAAYLFAGDAMNHARSAAGAAAGIVKDAEDVTKVAMRLRMTF